MSVSLQRDLERIERELLALSAMAEEMIAKACVAVIRRDKGMAREVVATDRILDLREVQIEEECLKILAIHQPLATDLRRTTAVLKINNDLERIGDLAVNIAQVAERLTDLPLPRVTQGLEALAASAREMVRQALDAFIQRDAGLARHVCRGDDMVDTMRDQIDQRLLDQLRENPADPQSTFQMLRITQNLERIADHATNIAEDTLYLVEGTIARHPRRFPDASSETTT